MKLIAALVFAVFIGSGSLCFAQEPPADKPRSDLEREVFEQLFGPIDDPDAGGNPVSKIAGEMTVVVGELARQATGKPTQAKQQQIVSQLDELIAQLEQECEACKNAGRSGRNPTRPLADSVLVGGPGGIGSLHAPKPDGKKWAELPPKERDRILQSQAEGFPSHYQRILERYYRRVAEEQPVVEGDSKARPPDAP